MAFPTSSIAAGRVFSKKSLSLSMMAGWLVNCYTASTSKEAWPHNGKCGKVADAQIALVAGLCVVDWLVDWLVGGGVGAPMLRRLIQCD